MTTDVQFRMTFIWAAKGWLPYKLSTISQSSNLMITDLQVEIKILPITTSISAGYTDTLLHSPYIVLNYHFLLVGEIWQICKLLVMITMLCSKLLVRWPHKPISNHTNMVVSKIKLQITYQFWLLEVIYRSWIKAGTTLSSETNKAFQCC